MPSMAGNNVTRQASPILDERQIRVLRHGLVTFILISLAGSIGSFIDDDAGLTEYLVLSLKTGHSAGQLMITFTVDKLFSNPIVCLSLPCQTTCKRIWKRYLNPPAIYRPIAIPNYYKNLNCAPVRLQLELYKPELALEEHHVQSTIVLFGGTQLIEKSKAEARLQQAQTALKIHPNNVGLQRAVARYQRLLDRAGVYDAARRLRRLLRGRIRRIAAVST